MSETISVPAGPVTMLTVCVLIDGKEMLLDVFRNEDIAKGVLIGGTHVGCRSVLALNETLFLVTYSLGILAEGIGSAIEKIDEWLGKLWLSHEMRSLPFSYPKSSSVCIILWGFESVVFNTGLNDI